MLPVLVLIGPTASGKTTLAVATAKAAIAGGQAVEIVNGDSMLVYRGMDIGTAKPTLAERAGVPHHLIDVLDVTQTASVAQFQGWARDAIADCRRRGVLPIVVGGSALYVHAIVDEMQFPGTDPVVRARWEAELARLGPAVLHEELTRRDPTAAAAILPGNGRRIVRALEVIEMTGTYQATLPQPRYAIDGVVQIGLTIDRDLLDTRIAVRVQAMWDAGFVDEVRGLTQLRDGLTASRALGYRQVLDFLDNKISEDEARAATIQATRRFARKQAGWFKRDGRITWVGFDAPGLANRLAKSLISSH
ncbi:MAG: tRNA (adenosine(37)-N6)-dimethylallyltransferase MiaA [Propionibacteriaceae bacterium]|nr:tRNA (adenosine(37)-N6)-dimethylallyltransferase MiaA [Propionibacteriaceae bacterium]